VELNQEMLPAIHLTVFVFLFCYPDIKTESYGTTTLSLVLSCSKTWFGFRRGKETRDAIGMMRIKSE
jgi:hypothetical protein